MTKENPKQNRLNRRDFNRIASLAVGNIALWACTRRNPFANPEIEGPDTNNAVTENHDQNNGHKGIDTTFGNEEETKKTYLEKYIYPALTKVAMEKRQSKAKKDREYWRRVDKELNEGRLNFALLGIGTEGSLTDSIQIISLSTETNEMEIIALQRDMWAPEITKVTGNQRPYRINQAHYLTGMEKTGEILENATGLSADFVVVMKQDVLLNAVDKVFGNDLLVDLPWDVPAKTAYFSKGQQLLDKDQVLRVARERYYLNNSARNTIQQLIIAAMIEEAATDLSGDLLSAGSFINRALSFYEEETNAGNIETNFNDGIFLNLGVEMSKEILTNIKDLNANGFGIPKIKGNYEVKVEHAGDPYDPYRLKPIDGDPNADDLVTNFWHEAREEVRNFLEK